MSFADIINKKLESYVKTSNGKKQVSQYIKNNSKFGGIYYQDLKKEAEKLKQFIQQEIDNYYRSYTPRVYNRTDDWRNSLIIDTTSDGQLMITFDESKAFHKSLFGYGEAYAPILMDGGWSWNKPHNVINRFTDFDGLNYIENAINKYLAVAPNGIKFTVKQTDFYGQTIEKTYLK